MAKPTRSEVLTLGLPPPAAASPGQLVERADALTGLLYYRAHGLTTGDALTLRLASSTTTGAPALTLPSPLAEGTTYEAVVASDDAFRLRTVGGATIAGFATAGTGRIYYLTDPWVALDAAIDEADVLIQDALAGHGGTVDAAILFQATRHLAAVIYVHKTCAQDPAKLDSYKGLLDLFDRLYAPRIESWRKGIPVRGAVDATPDTADAGSVVVDLVGGPFDAAEELRA